mgnify:FL=1
MATTIALFYRTYIKDYVVNNRGKDIYEPKECVTFPEFNDALDHLVKNYGGKKNTILIDDHCLEEGSSNLERKLKKAKIKIE